MVTVMNNRRKPKASSADSAFLLKLVLYLIVGSQWVWLVDAGLTRQIPLPIGLIAGFLFASHEHFRVDRKIEYALVLIASFIGFWSHAGIYIYVL
jgi:hypothetical protein